jgi:hypothetical protein
MTDCIDGYEKQVGKNGNKILNNYTHIHINKISKIINIKIKKKKKPCFSSILCLRLLMESPLPTPNGIFFPGDVLTIS